MIRNNSQKGSVPIIILTVLIVALVGILGVVFWQKFTKAPAPQDKDTPQASIKNGDTAASRDATRKKYAGQFASTLFSMHLLQGQTPESSQQGLDFIAALASEEPITDPSTGKSYVFNSDQASMKIGEATFEINSTCDNKVSGSGNTGLIIDGSSKSVAVALKLESGAFACESNL